MEKRKRKLKHKIMQVILIVGAVTMIPITAWLIIRFNWYFLGYPLVYASWAVTYIKKHGLYRRIRSQKEILFDDTHELLGEDAAGVKYYRNKLTNETEEQ